MKKPDKVKKGLEICIGECTGNKPHCPYHTCGNGCMDTMNKDARAYIQQLEPIKALIEQYISEHHITCSEDIWQRDKPQEEAIVLADKLCRLVGYMEATDE